MRVLMIHEHGRSHGGGALVAMHRLHTGLRQAGVNSIIACRRKQQDTDDIVELPRSDRLENLLGTISWRVGLNDVHCVSTFKLKSFKPFLEADVVNLHGLHTNYFNYLALPGLGQRKPLVMTLHDMWALTGHCSHSHECERWRTGCGKCPHLDVYPPVGRDATAIEWRLKRWVYNRTPMTIVSPSRWLANLARQSILQHYPVHHIPNGVDTAIYKPMNQRDCREELGIPHDKLVIMFACAAMDNPGKGGDLLAQALQQLSPQLKKRSMLLLAGDRSEAVSDACGIPAVALGFLRDDQSKIAAYSAADIFVLPSRAENHSLVLLEALSCGAPAVAFDVGGNSEIVRHLQTGYLAKSVTAENLAAGITCLLEDQNLREMVSRKAREIIRQEFSLQQHVERYLELYRDGIEQANVRKVEGEKFNGPVEFTPSPTRRLTPSP